MIPTLVTVPVPHYFDAKRMSFWTARAPKGVALSLGMTQRKGRTYNSSPPQAGFMGG